MLCGNIEAMLKQCYAHWVAIKSAVTWTTWTTGWSIHSIQMLHIGLSPVIKDEIELIVDCHSNGDELSRDE